ncbi:MAG: pre-peptidase C-terminal domain-containing protein, partial [Planctomycetes bacterium]|nr:pre-peptidase C-terminal domain-containing protein [Planctomycetota bacterium]
ALCTGLAARAELPNPVLHTVFPPGGQAGTSVTVTVDGSALDGLSAIRLSDPRIKSQKGEGNQFTIAIPAGTPTGLYDVRAVGMYGMSSPRAFFVSNRAERIEAEPNNTFESAQQVPLDVVLNGRIDKPGDVDCYRFTARAGQRVVLDCWAERIDSQLRGVLEVYDTQGKRLAVNRGYSGVDPLVDFCVPTDGSYTVKLFDLTFAGSSAHFYRLDIDTGPRVEFAVPAVLEQGKTTRVALFGRNLAAAGVPGAESSTPQQVGVELGLRGLSPSHPFDRVQVEVTPPQPGRSVPASFRMRPAQVAVDAFPYYYPDSNAAVLLSVIDVPVIQDASDNHSPASAQEIASPCEVSGQLTAGDEQDWFAVRASRGELLWLEAFGERIGSPVDLDVVVLDPSGERELAHFSDCLENLGGYRFPTSHLDPAGRWVVPADGRYLILVRNLIGGASHDPRRVYRLSVRREEPDFHLAVVSRRTDQPAGLNVWRGGRELMEVLAIRRLGLTGPIHVTADDLPPGIECPGIWLGPGVDRAPLVVTAGREATPSAGVLTLTGRVDLGVAEIVRPARGGTMVWPGQPTGSGRLTQEIPLAIAPEAPLLLTASLPETQFHRETGFLTSEPVVYQDSVLDVAIDVERRFEGYNAAINLTGVGLPRPVENQIATIPAGKDKGWISFHLPALLAPGPYTFAVQAETEVPPHAVSPGTSKGNIGVTVASNPITIRVAPTRVALEIDPRTPRKIARGKIIQLKFAAERKNGFVGKIHAELAAPGGVVGLRARGVTLVGQSDSGTLQVVATEDAPLGRQPFLRLEAVGTVEDQPLYHSGRFVELEITD